jgi:5-methylthioadenosine/S-adenosylhomocysteine deaminase
VSVSPRPGQRVSQAALARVSAHAFYADDNELDIIKKHGALISHASKTYMRFGFSGDILKRALNKDVKFSLATDGPASNSNLSIFESARNAALLLKLNEKNAEVANIGQILPLMINGGINLGFKTGKIEEGFLADIVFIDKYSINLNPDINIFANILYSLSQKDIKHVMVDGKFVVKDGKILNVDIENLLTEVKKIKERLLKKSTDKPMQKFGV